MTPSANSLLETTAAKPDALKTLAQAQPAGQDFVIDVDKGRLVARSMNTKDEAAIVNAAEKKAAVTAISQALLRIPELQPRLQLCVVRAKL